ncbi:MAG: hypothetical protein GC160_04465 [Acidobacteria bacterium]|nr:hypothetical protein [Acidobacteriota bacterium]
MARIVTVYNQDSGPFRPIDMSLIRWLKVSEALARRGHAVDIATCEAGLDAPLPMAPNLRRVPLAGVRWADYDVVKTVFHRGFDTLEAHGGADHPFVISKLGSVVADSDRPDVFFYGEERERLYRIQERVSRSARYVTLLTGESIELWREQHGERPELLLVPGAADAELPAPGPDPYPPRRRPRCLFAGNIYDGWSQAEVHRLVVDKLNRLGALLAQRGVDFFFVGRGDTSRLAPENVSIVGPVPHERAWDYMRHADVGVVLAFGRRRNVNESTKIYHYLRTGLPAVCEQGFPNEGLIEQAGLGFVTPFGDLEAMADRAFEACQTRWDSAAAVRMILEGHTWDQRVAVYDRLLRDSFGEPR